MKNSKSYGIGLVLMGLLLLVGGPARAADLGPLAGAFAAAGNFTFQEKIYAVAGGQSTLVSTNAGTLKYPDLTLTVKPAAGDELTYNYSGGAWTKGSTFRRAAADDYTNDEVIFRELGFDPAWALTEAALTQSGRTVTVTAGGKTYTLTLDTRGRVTEAKTPTRTFKLTYSTPHPIASKIEVHQGGALVMKITRERIAPAQSSGLFSGLGNALGIGSGSNSSQPVGTVGARGLGDEEGEAVTADEGIAVGENGLPECPVTREEIEQFIRDGGLRVPDEPVAAEAAAQ